MNCKFLWEAQTLSARQRDTDGAPDLPAPHSLVGATRLQLRSVGEIAAERARDGVSPEYSNGTSSDSLHNALADDGRCLGVFLQRVISRAAGMFQPTYTCFNGNPLPFKRPSQNLADLRGPCGHVSNEHRFPQQQTYYAVPCS